MIKETHLDKRVSISKIHYVDNKMFIEASICVAKYKKGDWTITKTEASQEGPSENHF